MRSRVYFRGGWRLLKRLRGVRFLKYGRSWLRIRRYGRRYRVHYRGKKWPIFRGKSKYQVKFLRRWRYVKRRGKARYIRLGRRWIRVTRRRLYYMRYRGRKLVVRRKGRRYQIRFGRRWLRRRRARYGKKVRARGNNHNHDNRRISGHK